MVSRGYRLGLFGLLVMVVVTGITLALVIAHTGRQVNSAATPLLKEKLPLLRRAASLEERFLRYQVTLNQYYALGINRTQFFEYVKRDELEIEAHIQVLRQSFGDTSEIRQIQASYLNAKTLSPKLDQLLETTPVDWDEARAVLVELDIDTADMRKNVETLEHAIENEVYAAGELTRSSIDRITWMVYLYGLVTLLTAFYVAYHIRARLHSEDRLAYQAQHDPLTSLPNRRSFDEQLQALSHEAHWVALLVIDRFERIAGGLGHAASDRLLREMASRIDEACKTLGGRLFRLDGAAFAVLRPMAGGADAAEVLSGLRAISHRPFEIEGYEVIAKLSVGAACFPQDNPHPVELLKRADAALQAARHEGGDRLVMYSPSLDTRGHERLQLEGLLSHAVERGELELFYQPQQCLGDDRLIGAEALVRWRRDGKLISPADFIPIAEESGLIVPMGAWILETACQQARRWNEGVAEPFVVAVNISARQFQHTEFLHLVRDVLARTQVNPAVVELEITESVIMQDAERTIAQLCELRDMGLKLAIDDFGTGYSSLAYLKRFPLDKLKVDQSFVRNLQPGSSDAAIVQAVIGLGVNLGLKVIAEGVETEAQRAYLHTLSCHEIQGYLYARPQPAEAVSAFIAEARKRQIPVSIDKEGAGSSSLLAG